MTSSDLVRLEAENISAVLDLGLGQIAAFSVHRGERDLAPFHRVPWADSEDDTLFTKSDPHLRRMSVDFFCAPFGASDVEPAPFHGWPGNSAWDVLEIDRFAGGVTGRFQLRHTVMGATVVKELTLRDNHPFLYQSHVFRGGHGRIPVAYHAMVSIPGDAHLSFSPKVEVMTPAIALETDPARGHSHLLYPTASRDLTAFPSTNGTLVDLTRYPIASDHEDLVMMVEEPGRALGWSVAARVQQRDLALVLKSPNILPFTVLWYSNGGRFYPPWNGRHTGVLGMEEVCSYINAGHDGSLRANPLSDKGYPTALALEPDLTVRSVIGALEWIAGADRIENVTVTDQGLHVCTRDEILRVPFDRSFLL